jgi:hypothetical protein
MKFPTAVVSVATLSLAMLVPALGQTPTQSAQDAQAAGLSEAQHMVPVRASLTSTLDAQRIKTGDQFRATLNQNVHLDSGVELHRGDVLLGQVVADDMNTAGNARLAVRFTEVDRKKGQSIPVKATIVALYTPSRLLSDSDAETEQYGNSWTDNVLSIDEIGVLNGVDLHSRISSLNSGVFVTTTKKNVKIPAGSEIALAIAAQPNTSTTNSGE